MQIIKILSLGFIATALWNCNDVTQPENAAAKDSRVPAIINGMTKVAAGGVGYSAMTSATTPTTVTAEAPNPFSLGQEEIKALQDAGICQGFVDLMADITTNSASIKAGVIPPRLQEVSNCFAANASLVSSDSSFAGFFSIATQCFCGASGGSLFGNFESTLFTKYAAPKIGATYTVPVSGTLYTSPGTPGGSGFSASGSAGGSVYTAPGL